MKEFSIFDLKIRFYANVTLGPSSQVCNRESRSNTLFLIQDVYSFDRKASHKRKITGHSTRGAWAEEGVSTSSFTLKLSLEPS